MNGRASGVDKIPAELYKYATRTFKLRLLRLLNLIFRENRTPEGSAKMHKMDRCISLLCVTYKWLARMTVGKILAISEPLLLEPQNGFRRKVLH